MLKSVTILRIVLLRFLDFGNIYATCFEHLYDERLLNNFLLFFRLSAVKYRLCLITNSWNNSLD